MKNINVAVIGLGVHACRGHIDHFSKSGINLLAVSDPSETAVEKFHLQYGNGVPARPFDDILKDNDIEAVMIMSPDRYHVEQTLSALNHGKNVFCEKPLCDNPLGLYDLKTAFNIAKLSDLVFSTCHPRRFDRPFIFLKENMETFVEWFGPVLGMYFDFSYYVPTRYGLHQGLLIDHFNHEIDLAQFLFGPSSFRAVNLTDSETRYDSSGIRDDGIAIHFSGTRMLKESHYTEFTTIRFERGDIRINCGSGVAIVTCHSEKLSDIHDSRIFPLDHYNGTMVCGTTDYDGRFVAVNTNFARSVRKLKPNYLTHEEMFLNTRSSVVLTSSNNVQSF